MLLEIVNAFRSGQERLVMSKILILIVGLFLAVFLSGCATAPGDEKARVKCPACGMEFDALIQTRF